MSVELTSFELLTLATDNPVREQYDREQEARRGTWQTDYCSHVRLGALCLGHVIRTQAESNGSDQGVELPAAS